VRVEVQQAERPAPGRDRAQRRLGDRVVAAQDDRDCAGVGDLPDRLLDRGVGRLRVGRDHGRVSEVDRAQLPQGVDAGLEMRSRRAARRPDRTRPVARPGAVGDEVVGRGADDRDVHALELGRILGVREAAEGEEARVVRLVAEILPAPERVDHR
jgi:hypothetical protein